MLTRTGSRRFPMLFAALAVLALAAVAMAMLFSPVQAQEGSAPDQPTGLDATATHDSVTLTWDDPDDDSITGYVILRRVRVNDTGGDFDVLVADTGTDATTYTDDTVAAETRYTYRIKAINGAGTSERSRWVHIDVPAAPEPTPATPQRRSEYIDAHNAGVHDLAELMDGADPLDPDAWDTEEEEDERVAGKPGKSVGTQQNRSSHTVDICDRTPEVEAALLAFIQETDSSVTCSTVTAAQLASVDYLYIEDGYGSGEIVPGDFANLTGLIELSISGSSELTTVPANAFSELSSLTNFENLGLGRNRIQSVHRDAFDGLTFSRVGSIDLHSNQIQTLEPGTFDGVTGLEFLNLSVNHIKAFEDGFFENLTGLKELTISNNPLRAIDRDTLRGLSSLQNLTIASTPLSTLHPDAFNHLSALERLILQNNDIAELPAAIFADGPDSLREIRLSGNKIPSLDSETFANLTGLEFLFLSSNELTVLPANIFESQGDSLTELYLGGNDFSSSASLPADVFDGLTGLEKLYLHGSGLASLDEDLFNGLTALQRLSLNNNDFSSASLPADVFDGLSGLQWLYLYGSSLTSLDEDLFDGLTALQRLYLYDNGLTSLDEDLFDGLTALQWLLLSDNDFSSLPADVFEGLDDLQILYLHRAGLTSLDADLFEPLDDSLLYLYLHGNGLTSLDEDLFDGLTGLQRLYLHGNSLTSLAEDLFDGLTALQRLYLDGNDLTSLEEDLFDDLSSLQDLNLDENLLSALTADVFDGLDDSLTDLYLRDNDLTALPSGVFDGLTGLLRLDLSCNALTALGLDELDPFAGTLKYLDVGANSFANPPTEAAVNAKLTAVEELYLTGSPPCLPAFDTGLSALSLSTGTLTPAFVAPGIPGYSGYRADVGSDVSELTVTVAPKDPHASIEPASPSPGVIYDDDLETSGLQVHLDNRSTVRWQVRAENGAATQVYNVSVYREHPPGSVARLRSLELDGLTLTPEFSSITYGYEAASPASATQTTVAAIPLDPDATIEYLDSSDNTLAAADSTEDGHQVALDVGDTVFKVKVTAEDDTATQTYTMTVTRPASSDDCSADIATTCEVDVGGSAMGNIETADDKDYFRIDLVSDTKYQFDLEGDDTTRGNLGDPFLQLANSRGTVLGGTGNRDSGVGDNARVIWTPANIGNESVYLIVEGAARTTGTYTLSAIVLGANGNSEADTDFPATTSTTGRVEVGASATGTIGADNDDDWFRVDLEAGKTYQFDMEGMDTGRGTQPDPYVELTNSSGNRDLGFDNNAGVNKNARLIYTADAAGTHYVVAATGSDEQGTYTLSVRDVTPPPDLPADTSTTGVVEVDGSAVSGDIFKPFFVERTGDNDVDGYTFDTDWFAVELEAGGTYRIEMKGQILSSPGLNSPGVPVDPELTLRLPQINAIYDADGDYLVNTFSRDESSAHHLFRVTFHAHADGIHYIAASGESFEWGGYELRVKDITRDDGDDGDDTNPQQGAKNLRAVEEKSGVRLTWQSPDGVAVTGYRIERRRAGGQDSGPQRSHGQPGDHHTLVEDTGNTETSYVDESAEQGVEYEYRVTVRSESGPGEESDWVRAGPASASNNPATGAPTISGTTQVGQTLTADITGISDADGLSGETFAYQWVSSDGTTDSDISGATNATYTLAAADRGKAIKVRVTFTDDGGNEETLTSAPTAPVWGDSLPGAPRNLAATPGNKEVTLSWDPPADNGNAPPTRYRIEWRVDGKDYDRNDWGTSQETTYTTNAQANLANGVKYVFRVKAGNGSGNGYGPYGPASGEVSATPTSGSAVDLGTPVLSRPETLHHGMVQLDWQDIEDAGWYVVQHYHLEDGEWLDLPAEGVDIAVHGSSAVVSNLHGGLHWLRVGAASCAGSSEWSQIEQLYGTNASDWEGVPVPEVEEGDEIAPCPVVLGTPVLSDTEILHHGMVQLDWQDIEEAGWYVVQYYRLEDGEWLDLPAEGVDIAFHGSSAVVSNLHGLSWLRIGAASCDGASEWSQIEESYGTNASDWKGVPVPEVAEGDEIETCSEDADTPDNSPATGAPTISGTAQVGETLTANTSGIADADGLSSVQYEYQWLADDAEISGATNATYTLTDSEESKAITVQVSFTDDADNEETLTSAATDAVAAVPQSNSPATGAPTISGTAQVGETLTADTSGIADADGLSNVQYEYQWLADDAEIAGATGLTYTLTDSEESKAITVQVSFTDDADNEETRTSAATAAVAGAQPTEPPAKPTGLEATASHDAVTLTWDDPGDDSITGYVILRRIPGVDPEGHFNVLVANTAAAATTYTDDTVSAETRYTYRIKAINGAGTSERSRWFHIDVPAAPVPDKPTGLEATGTHGQVVLTWDDPGDDSITGYVILRRVRENDTGGDFSVLVADTGTAALTYTDDTVAASLTYTYRIKAINEHGTSERSRWYHIDIPAAP